jgi:hypothetical protein
MTGRQRNALGILASIALTLMILSCRSCSGGEVRHAKRMTRATVTRPIKAKGRAAAGYPGLKSVEHVTSIGASVAGLLNPLNWLWGRF